MLHRLIEPRGVMVCVCCLMCATVTFGVEDTFNATFGSSGDPQGGGSGYNNGRWYYYPNSGYYTQWFDNRPYNPQGYKVIRWSLTVAPTGYGANYYPTIEIAINWTSNQWGSKNAPPLPSDFGSDSQAEEAAIKREVVRSLTEISGPRSFSGEVRIPNYCPAWISIDFQATDVRIYNGVIEHECIYEAPQYDYDWGDAPYPPYPTLAANNGARHLVDNQVYLGAQVDTEADGQPNANATGDDNNNLDDEDGVVFTSALVAGSTADVDVTASAFGFLNAWIDFDGNGDWSGTGEQIFTNQPLSPGVNSLSFPVPAGATAGNTYCRFRFSSFAGLSYTGPANNGEVEDHQVRIEQQYDQDQYFKWEQPPIEYDPYANTPVYCGWDQPSYVVIQGTFPGSYTTSTNWSFAVDDFRCLGTMPITSVHWWGSYINWNQTDYPAVRPNGWVIGFWSNVPEGTDKDFSHPGQLLKVVFVPANQVTETWIGRDRFPGKDDETCYKYYTSLKPDQYFWQDRYKHQTQDNVYWLSVTALYSGTQYPRYPWGWKTRPAHWMDDAVTFITNTSDFSTGYQPPASMRPIENSDVCQEPESYDLAFALDTDPDYVKWDQPFTGLRDWQYYKDEVSMAGGAAASSIAIKWEQPPDTNRTGVDVDATWEKPATFPAHIVADDFECTNPGPITEIDIWGSWLNGLPPSDNPDGIRFTLNIHRDIPATGAQYSRPGEILWSKTYQPGEYSVLPQNTEPQGYYSPSNSVYLPSNHDRIYQYTFTVPDDQAYQQSGTPEQPVVYWLSVQAYLDHGSQQYIPARWGWKTSTREWNDVAVYAQSTDAGTASWQTLGYPFNHSYYGRKTGMAFRIITSDYSESLFVQHQVADDWLCNSPYPITAATWWGSYQGYTYEACACKDQPAPQKPDYFWISLWTDIPDPYPNDDTYYSEPNELVWEYNAFDYDEVLVGYDNYAQSFAPDSGYEAVYRYSVRIPKQYWFYQPGKEQVYWLSIVAVYYNLDSVPYDWGWTNHRHVYNDTAVTTMSPLTYPYTETPQWVPLYYNQTRGKQDMSFTLFTDPNEYQPVPVP